MLPKPRNKAAEAPEDGETKAKGKKKRKRAASKAKAAKAKACCLPKAKAKGAVRRRLTSKTKAARAPAHGEGGEEVLGKAVTKYRTSAPVEAYVLHYNATLGRRAYVGSIKQTSSLRYKEFAEQVIK